MFYVSYFALIALAIFIVHKIASRNLLNICSFWYLDKKKNEIVQYFNLSESFKLLKLRKRGRRHVVLYTRDTMLSAANSSKLEAGKTYYIEYHLLKHMRKASGVRILSCEFKSERFLWESIFFLGIKGYLKLLLSKKRNQLKVKYYTIAFMKIEGVKICIIE